MKTSRLLRPALLIATMAAGMSAASAQTTVLTEDFSGDTNIFGVTATELAVGASAIHNTGLDGYGPVLAVCKATAEGTIANTDGQPIAATDGTTVTAEWDAFHGYFGNSRSTTVSLLNSDGQEVASYTYASNNCQITAAKVGGTDVAGFAAFSLQSRANASQGANGFGGNGRPYTANAAYNPHVAVTLSARGSVTIDFTLQGNTTSFIGTVGSLKKDIAKMRIVSSVENTDRCYAIDNITVRTDALQEDPDYVETIVGATIVGPQTMTFGPSPDEAAQNAYTVQITGSEGTLITAETLSAKVTDFNIRWHIDGFQTENDTEGQYCDSYGQFSVNNSTDVATTFDLRDVPMNFFGRLTATITYNGETFVAEKYVMAQGDLSRPATQVLPLAGFPSSLSAYPDAIVGYQVVKDTYGTQADPMLGGWCMAGSDGPTGTLLKDQDGTKYVRVVASNMKKSHVMTKTIDAPTGQVIFPVRLRFNNTGAVLTLTGGYPFWSASKYTCPVQLSFDGSKLSLNGTALTLNDADAAFTTATWYDVVLSADKSSETCYALVYDTTGKLLGESGLLTWAETSSPTYFSVGMGNSVTGSIDLATYEAYLPTADTDSYTLTADKTTLSIPQGDTALLTATLNDTNGHAITGLATWSVVEQDMQQAVIITPAEADSHQATVSLADGAEAGTATIQVSIGGVTKTVALSLTTSAESIRFTQSTQSITIPMDDSETATATFRAIHIDGDGNELATDVTLTALDRDGLQPLAANGITFDAATGTLTVTASATPTLLTIRATCQNSEGNELSKNLRVNIHGMKFDFGYSDDDALADGFTLVSPQTAYTDLAGYGIKSGTATAAGTASTTDATADYLEGAIEFDFKAQVGAFYTVEVTFQGTLTTGYVNSDLAGYELGSSDVLTTQTFTIPATLDVIDLRIAANDATTVARIAQITVTKQPQRAQRGKRVVHHIGDSTSANNGSWAYRLRNLLGGGSYADLAALCDFHNDGAGGRNLSTYYTQGKLASVLRDIYPGDILMFGNNGTNGMGSSFEADVNYYLDAAEALGAQVIINSYTPHGAVASYTAGYNASTNTFDSYRRDSYETVVRRVADQRAATDANYLGFVEIGKNADAAFNAYVADYAANGYATADAAAQAIIQCFTDHNHYSNGTLACTLMLDGYADVEGIVAQLTKLLSGQTPTAITQTSSTNAQAQTLYDLQGRKIANSKSPDSKLPRGLYIVAGRKHVVK